MSKMTITAAMAGTRTGGPPDPLDAVCKRAATFRRMEAAQHSATPDISVLIRHTTLDRIRPPGEGWVLAGQVIDRIVGQALNVWWQPDTDQVRVERPLEPPPTERVPVQLVTNDEPMPDGTRDTRISARITEPPHPVGSRNTMTFWIPPPKGDEAHGFAWKMDMLGSSHLTLELPVYFFSLSYNGQHELVVAAMHERVAGMGTSRR